MKHHGKLIAAATGVALVSLVMVLRGRNYRLVELSHTDPSRPPTIEARDVDGKLLLSRVIEEGQTPWTIVEDLQRELAVTHPEGGKLTVINGQKWWGILAPGVWWTWGPAPTSGG